MKRILMLLGALLVGVSGLNAAEPLIEREWSVDGVTRQALIHVPATAKEKPAPLVFAFHGHGGNMKQASNAFPIPKLWPEALVVYMQGLNTPGKLTDPEGKKPGWQHGPGVQEDRDLKFFDTVMKSLKADYRVDASRIYSMGHSNGGGFTYLLWAERGDLFAAMAPSGSAASQAAPLLKPKPVLHIAGEKDPLVKYEWQEKMIEHLIKLNGVGEGVAWELDANCTLYPSANGTPVITAIHPGGHEYPKQAPAVAVKFFKQHQLPIKADFSAPAAKPRN